MLPSKLFGGLGVSLRHESLRTCLLGGFKNMRCPNRRMCIRHYSSSKGMKVTICGAAGQTGQPLALLLKQSPLIDELALYDLCSTSGCGLELSHVDTKCRVSAYTGRAALGDALQDSNVVIIVARNCCDTFENSSPVVCELALQQCYVCPDAFTIIATEPVESMTPLIAEIQRLRCVYNPRKLLGCVELHSVRANTVLADFLHVQPERVRVPVIAGARSETMVPVLSSAVHPGNMSQEQIECICSSIMGGNAAVCAAKGCATATPCLAGAYAVARTAVNVIKGLQGQKDVVQLAYADNMRTCCPDCQFFSSEVVLGASGIEKNLGVPELTKFENCLLHHILPYVRNEQARAVNLVYSICMQQSLNTYCSCTTSSSCYTGGYRPPPCGNYCGDCNWCGECCTCRDPCLDEYLASVCREMTGKCGTSCLCWKPREPEFNAERAAKIRRVKTDACDCRKMPRSMRLAEAIKERAKKENKA